MITCHLITRCGRHKYKQFVGKTATGRERLFQRNARAWSKAIDARHNAVHIHSKPSIALCKTWTPLSLFYTARTRQ